MSRAPRRIGEVLQAFAPEEMEWSGFLPAEEIDRRLEDHFGRGGSTDLTVIELACQLQIPPAQLYSRLLTSRWGEWVAW
jgi:hypothetical protein